MTPASSSCSPCAERCAWIGPDGSIAIVDRSGSITPKMKTWPARVDRWRALVEYYAAKHGAPPVLIAGVMAVESGGDPSARSYAGAMGLMQIMPGTYRSSVGKDAPLADAMRPEVNIEVGTKLLASLLASRHGNLVETIVSYNAGSPRCGVVERCEVDPWQLREDCGYVDKVLGAINSALERGYSWQPGAVPPARASGSSVGAFAVLAAVVGTAIGLGVALSVSSRA